jgi:adiponectin receptor
MVCMTTNRKSRRATFSYFRSVKSIFRIHNEAVNIWSHILGAAAFTLALNFLYILSSKRRDIDNDSSTTDVVAVFMYFVSVIACFVFSFMQV